MRKLTPLLLLALLLSACGGGEDSISASTSCADYFKHDASERHDAAQRISIERKANDAGNPNWGLTADSACGADQEITLGEVFQGGSDSTTEDTALGGPNANEPLADSFGDPQNELCKLVNDTGVVEALNQVVNHRTLRFGNNQPFEDYQREEAGSGVSCSVEDLQGDFNFVYSEWNDSTSASAFKKRADDADADDECSDDLGLDCYFLSGRTSGEVIHWRAGSRDFSVGISDELGTPTEEQVLSIAQAVIDAS